MSNTKINASINNIRKRQRRMTILWIVAVTAVIVTLMYLGQIAMLYVLATLSVTALLVIVALADFGEARRETQMPPFDDSAALGDRQSVV